MTDNTPCSIPALPRPLHWHNEPLNWKMSDDGTLSITAGANTDWFISPEVGNVNHNAPALLMDIDGPCMLTAHVEANHASTFDAVVLAVYQSDTVWAKFCLEFSPQNEAMVVSVVTKGVSDDCNALTVPGNDAYYRISRLENSYAFHYSSDGKYWNLIRHFTLGDFNGDKIGFLAQSPMGESCTAKFSEISYRAEKLNDIRSGE